MAFGKRRKLQQQSGEGEQGRKRFVGREELMRFFAKFVDGVEELMQKQAELDNAIETGSRKDVERPMDDVSFRSQTSQIRQQISEGLKKASAESGADWFGPFDGWLKAYANESYGSTSDFAKEHGADDWTGRMIYIVLPGQASKHNTLARWAEFAGMELVETKTGFKPVYEAVIKKMAEGAPKRSDFKSSQEYLETRAEYNKSYAYFRKTRKDVEDWLAGKKQDGGTQQPQKSEAEQLRESVAEDVQRLVDLRKQSADHSLAGNDKAASATQAVIREVNGRIEEAEARLKELKGSKPAGADERLQRAANVMASEPTIEGEPIGKPTVAGDAKAAKAKADDTDARMEALKADIARLETEIEKQARSAEGHRAKAQELYGKADLVRDAKGEDYRKVASRLEMAAEREESSAVTAEGLVKKAQTEIDRINGRIEELTKAAAKSPDEKKSKRKKSDAAPTGTVVIPTAKAKTPAPQASDSQPVPTGDLKKYIASQIAWYSSKGNTEMVANLTVTLKALGD